MSATPIRFAIVGTGSIARRHAQAIAAVPDAKLVAVWGRDEGRGRDFAAEHGADFVDCLETLAARDDVQAATIATPSGSHSQSCAPFLRAGKAVLCEKPIDVTLEKIDTLLALAQTHRAPLAAVLQLRFGAAAQALKKAVEQGRFGKLTLCSAYVKWWRGQEYYDSVEWRGTREFDGGGALMNQGIHAVDLLQWLVGMPSEVFAFAGRLAHKRIEVEDTIAVCLRFPHGAIGTIEATTASNPGSAMRIEICGDRGSAVWEDDLLTSWKFDRESPEDDALRSAQSSGIIGGKSDPAAIGIEGHRLLVADLVAAIREHRPPLIPANEARNAVRLILAAYDSASTGHPVSI